MPFDFFKSSGTLSSLHHGSSDRSVGEEQEETPSEAEEHEYDHETDEGFVMPESIVGSNAEFQSATDLGDSSQSINSDSLQDFGSVVSLPPGILADLIRNHIGGNQAMDESLLSEATSDIDQQSYHDHQTIVSSVGSSADLPPPLPHPSGELWAISPHPCLIAENVRAVSTICSESVSYQRLLNDAGGGSDGEYDDDDASTCASLMTLPALQSSAGSSRTSANISSLAMSQGHDRVSFVTVANRLMQESANGRKRWFSSYTERDWDQFRDVADMILDTVAPTGIPRAVPPCPPATLAFPPSENCSYDASTFLPKSFICPICFDVIVGAVTLDCGCRSSSVCSPCWEKIAPENGPNAKDKNCLSCRRPVTASVPCHALDVAILDIIQNLTITSPDANAMRANYYSRLSSWGEQVMACQDQRSKQDFIKRDEYLARLIQEEEDILWNSELAGTRVMQSHRSKRLLILSQAALAIVAASLASFGLKVLARR